MSEDLETKPLFNPKPDVNPVGGNTGRVDPVGGPNMNSPDTNAQKASEEADAKKGDEAARSNKPFEENVIQPSPVVGSPPNTVEAEKQREADRRKASEAQPNTGLGAVPNPNPPVTATGPTGTQADKPVPTIDKPIVGPAPTTGKPEVLTPGVRDEPIVHGEASQRFANRNAIHSERVLHGTVVTKPVRKERYEHPERNA